MGANLAVKNLVRNVLGCICPEEVFEQIEMVRVDTSTGPWGQARRIVVGDRLLLELRECNDTATLETALPELLAEGKARRDRRGLNRFRAVVASRDPARFEPLVRSILERFSARDDRLHVHVVPLSVLDQL